jgi:hypothetical protein
MIVPILIFALFFGLVDQFILDNALTGWVGDSAEKYWYWGVWVLVWLVFIIGDKLLKAIDSKGEAVLKKLGDINSNLDQVKEEVEWVRRNNQNSVENHRAPKVEDISKDGPWASEEHDTKQSTQSEADDTWHDQFPSLPPAEKSKAYKVGQNMRHFYFREQKVLFLLFLIAVVLVLISWSTIS